MKLKKRAATKKTHKGTTKGRKTSAKTKKLFQLPVKASTTTKFQFLDYTMIKESTSTI